VKKLPRLKTHVILLGMKGAGKTTIGGILARQLGVRFHDLDRLIEDRGIEKHGRRRTVRTIWKEDGQAGFRTLELEAAEWFARSVPPPTILAVGGGTVENTEAMEQLSPAGLLVYLDADPSDLYRRIMAGGVPPFLDGSDPYDMMYELWLSRVPLYRRYAAVTVSVRGAGPEQCAHRIIEKLRHRTEDVHARK
jgi:shikimate kinase